MTKILITYHHSQILVGLFMQTFGCLNIHKQAPRIVKFLANCHRANMFQYSHLTLGIVVLSDGDHLPLHRLRPPRASVVHRVRRGNLLLLPNVVATSLTIQSQRLPQLPKLCISMGMGKTIPHPHPWSWANVGISVLRMRAEAVLLLLLATWVCCCSLLGLLLLAVDSLK